jgi:enoyl-[acyl-carrier protein] reductase I
MIPVFPDTKVALKGKKGLIVGIANDQSIAWGCAKAFRALGADLAVTYLNERAKKHVEPLAQALEAPIFMPMDVMVEGQTEQVFERIEKEWGQLDFLLHSIAFSPKEALHGRVVDVGRDGFLKTMDVSCWSFMRMAHLAEPLMKNGGTMFTMTYYGSQMVVENYNVMGVAKAALEAAVRYVAAELGPKGIRVHAISPGPLATRAASGIPEFDELIGGIGLLALAANGLCLALLWRHRSDDINMSSVWECSRNDIASNIAVFVAAGGVWLTRSGWPDLLVGLGLACLFLVSAVRVLRGALAHQPVGYESV